MNRQILVTKENLLTFFVAIISMVSVYMYPVKHAIAFWIAFWSVAMLIKARNNSHLMILFGIIAYVNFSLIVSEVLGLATALPINTLSWQAAVRSSDSWLMGAQSLVVLLSIINVFFDKKFAKLTTNGYDFELKDNSIIFFVGYAIILFIWAFLAYGSSAGTTYTSDTSTLYEYCLVIVPILWLYSGNRKSRKFLLFVFIMLYCGKSMLHGDRSSMLPMLIFLYFMCFGHINIDLKKIIILAVCGVFVSNIISVYRTLGTQGLSAISDNLIAQYGSSFFTSDTVSQSYYTSVVVQLTHDKVLYPFSYFIDFIGGILLGGSFGNADVIKIVSVYYTNKYGGFYYSWFYFWGGILGVVIGSIFLGVIIRKIFMKNNPYFNVMKLIVIIFSLRWYVYTPFVFYRSVLFAFSVLYLICWLFDSTCKKREIRKTE